MVLMKHLITEMLAVQARHLSFPHQLHPATPRTVCCSWRRAERWRFAMHCKENKKNQEVSRPGRAFLWTRLDPVWLVQTSSAFYGAMTVSAIFLGRSGGVHVFEELSAPVDIVAGLLWTLPMVISLIVTISVTDRFPSLLKIKHLLQETLLPLLKKMPSWGPIVLAIGAGIGEEAFFRGWMQPALTDKLILFSSDYASALGILVTSLAFGLCHAATETYFVWATVFGALMGLECNIVGLPTAAFTHALYDWIAFVSLTEIWDPMRDETVR